MTDDALRRGRHENDFGANLFIWGESMRPLISEADLRKRLSRSFPNKNEMVLASYQEVADHAVTPGLLRLYSRRQVENTERSPRLTYFDKEARTYWVWCYSLTYEVPRLMPAAQVYLKYDYSAEEAVIGRSVSSGLAVSGTLEEAILGGLYQAVAHDTLAIRSYHRKIGTEIEIDEPGLKEIWRDRLAAGFREEVKLRAFEQTLDIPIPSVLLVAEGFARSDPTCYLGTWAHLSTRSAICEGLHSPDLRNVFLPVDLLPFLPGDSENKGAIRPSPLKTPLSQMAERSTGDFLADLERSIETLRSAGREVIMMDITTPELLEEGLRAVRVAVPGLVPLCGEEESPCLGAKRLLQPPDELEPRHPLAVETRFDAYAG